MVRMARVDILGAEIDPVTMEEAVHRCRAFLEGDCAKMIVTPNPEMVMKLVHEPLQGTTKIYDRSLWSVLRFADLVIPDGVGLLLAARILGERYAGGRIPERVSGVDLMREICVLARERSVRVALVGAAPGVAERAARVLKREIAGLDVVGLRESDDGSARFDDALSAELAALNPTVVFVAYGAEKQEQWMARNRSRYRNVRIMMGVGGAFDFLVGSKAIGAGVQFGETKRAPGWVRRIWLEWLWRALFAPWRWRRVFNATFVFLWWVLKYRLFMTPAYRPNVLACVYRVNDGGRLEVLVCSREDNHDHWQMPQGGIEPGETSHNAVARELKEEVGFVDERRYAIERELPERYRYRWPFGIRWWVYKRRYIGQEQRLFLVRFFGDRDEVDLRGLYANDDLFFEYRWVPADELLASLHPIRRDVAARFLPYLS